LNNINWLHFNVLSRILPFTKISLVPRLHSVCSEDVSLPGRRNVSNKYTTNAIGPLVCFSIVFYRKNAKTSEKLLKMPDELPQEIFSTIFFL